MRVSGAIFALGALFLATQLPSATAAPRQLLQNSAVARSAEAVADGSNDAAAAYAAVTATFQQRAAKLQGYAAQSQRAAAQRLGASVAAFKPGGNASEAPTPTGNERTATASAATLCGNGVCDSGESCSTCPQDCTRADGQPCNRVGVLYSGWHWPAWTASQAVRRKYHTAYDVEDILRTQVATTSTAFKGTPMNNITGRDGLTDDALGFYWQHRPQQNFYCIYHSRNIGNQLYNEAHESSYGSFTNVADCANWQSTVDTHAKQIWAAGIDNVVYDATNIDTYNPLGDALQLRPLQVLFEEWSNLRAAGTSTPDIAAWQNIPFSPATLSSINVTDYLFYYVLMLYNTQSYDRLVLRDPATNKKLFYYPSISPVDSSIIDYIESNGGRNDVLAVPMWTGQQKSGSWNFLAFCKTLVFIKDEACAQALTTSTVKTTGSQLAIVPTYQTTYAGIAFQSIGQWNGLTLKKQWATAIASQPQWVFLSSWNEHIAQPQPIAVTGAGASMGLDKDATFAGQTFVDTYGASFGRDLEPTVEGSTELYDLTASCIRAFKNAVATNSTTCLASEECCTGLSFSFRFQYYNDTKSGIFGLYANNAYQAKGVTVAETKLVSEKGDPAAAPYQDARLPLYSCLSTLLKTRPAFLSTSSTCEGIYSPKYLKVKKIGYISQNKGRGFLRPLMRCMATNRWRNTFSLGPNCPSPTKNDKVLGYVR